MLTEINSILQKKLILISQASDLFRSLRSEGKSVALCHGVFDLLHPGHLRHLAKAKDLADVLVVSITADNFVNKGPGRPAFNEVLRSEALSNLATVDYVITAPYETAIEVITYVKPNFFVKGNDYSDEKSDKTGNIVRERNAVEKNGGKIVFTDELVFSSSQLINQFLPTHSEESSSWLKEIKTKYSIDEIISWIEKISRLKVAVIGESIIDVYTECEALGKSSKDPVLCFNKGSSVAYAGGILAIGAHTKGLGAETMILTGLNHNDEDSSEIQNLVKNGIQLEYVDLFPSPTIRKERLVDSRTSTRVLELYEMKDKPISDKQDKEFIKLISDNVLDVDVLIIADYGHGLISDGAINFLSTLNKFIAVNAQTNAGNRGFNSVTRYSRVNYVTLNGQEAQLETRRRHVDNDTFISLLHNKSNIRQILITKGGDGLDLFSRGEGVISAPALAPFVKDRVGAGDAVLAITSLLLAVQAPPEIVCFLGNICGAWAVSFVGNEKSLDKVSLIKHASAILK